MANFKEVNKAIKTMFPNLNIDIVRGDGYIYYDGDEFDNIDSLYTHPVSTPTDDVIRLCVDDIEDYLINHL